MATIAHDSALAERVRELEDRFALNELVARYCAAVDDCDREALLELFTEDASFGSTTGSGATGRETLADFALGRAATEDWSIHYPHTHIIDFVSEDEARGVVLMHAEMGWEGDRCIRAAMRYNDEYKRVDGKWRFAKRLVQFYYCMDLGTFANGYDNTHRKQWPYVAKADLPESLETWRQLHPDHPNNPDNGS
jgi:uncharacterized protein (TIGR02246 family)